MSPTINFNYLSELLKKEFGETRSFTDDYIRDLTDIINTELELKNEVSIKNLGVFKKEKDADDQETIKFIPFSKYKRILSFRKTQKKARKKTFLNTSFIWIVFILILLIVVIFWINYISDQSDKEIPITNTIIEIDSGQIVQDTLPETELKESNIQVTEHRVIKTNNLWNISKKYYKKGIYWPLILSDNKDNIDNPDLIFPGNVLKISLLDNPDKLTFNDSIRLSESFNKAYIYYKNIDSNKAKTFSIKTKQYKSYQ
ncbi:MAG: LysM peptidoglycan-binding domain-containing protein [Bacteroidales bacterium]|nr:LysM peptidoglycan-binding domain-containing protein [Bacteroidales bacterium]